MTSKNANDLQDRLKALLARTSTATLIESLRALDTQMKQAPSPERSMAFAWTCDELERRCPTASEAVANAFLQAEIDMEATGTYVEVDYAATLLAAIAATFDPGKVAIERHRVSVTQGEVSVSYDGQLLGRFGDDIRLCTSGQHGSHGVGTICFGGFYGHDDQHWIDAARWATR